MRNSETNGRHEEKEQNKNNEERTRRICELNDRFRRTGEGGRQLTTPGIQEMGLVEMLVIRQLVASYDAFCEHNDPYGEHDFGNLKYHDEKILWKIDYYDATLTAGSPDPSDHQVTTRVLTIMLANEY
ncbi:MAG: DUF3768 domain-containing protein [Paracoccaceae bacterium]